MNEFDVAVFAVSSSPQLYQYIQRIIRRCRRIRSALQGRWKWMGVETDCNISSGEALTRQFLYGMRF